LRDIDDGLAIALALRSPEFEVAGITITHGNTDQRRACQSARRILKAAGREDVPVKAGADRKNGTSETDASRFLVDRLGSAPGALTLITLGPLSNIAAMEQTNPGTLRLARRVVAMGGAVDCMGFVPPWFHTEFNFFKDPAGAAILIREAPDFTLVPLDLTKKVIFGRSEMRRFAAADTPLAKFLYKHTTLWHALNSVIFMRGGFMPHDPLAVAYLLHPEWYETAMVCLSVVERGPLRGQIKRDPAGTPVRIAFSVDGPSFLDFLLERITC
jgi:purine nucleosidase